MIKNKTILFLFALLFISCSTAQETPNQLSYETPNLQTTEEPTVLEADNVSGTGQDESTYYMNTRPADFIQVINTNGTIINETYIYLQDKLIAKYDNEGRKFFYHPDHLGSTSLVTNESGDVVEDLLYLPYGCILTGNELSRFGYTGQENDQESGFIDYGARQYDCEFSRFLQTDPVIADIYNPQNLNRYSYVLNNPYKYTDPDGKFIVPAVVILATIWAIDVGVGLFKGGNEGKNFVQSYGVGVQEAGNDFGYAGTTAEGAGAFALNFAAGEAAVKILGKISKTKGNLAGDTKLKGAANPDTKATIEYGQKQHNEFYAMETADNPNAITDKSIPGTNLRPDSYDPVAGTVTELKPSSQPAINKGINQLKNYVTTLEKYYKSKFEPILKTYTSYKKKGG